MTFWKWKELVLHVARVDTIIRVDDLPLNYLIKIPGNSLIY